jgi:hypothetical protein
VVKLSNEHRRALRLLARNPTGCTEAFLLAHGISQNHIDTLILAKLAMLEPGINRIAGREKIVLWVQITDIGRKALAEL